ncbi:MAG: M28 family peptidase [Phycisphaerales bacterium]
MLKALPLLLALSLGTCQPLLAEEAVAPHHEPTASEAMKPFALKYQQHIFSLADPVMEGRAPGTNGNRMAANYIEFYWKQLGLRPAFTTPAEPGADADDDARAIAAADGEPGSQTWRQVFVAPPSRRPGDSVRLDRQQLSFGGRALSPGTDFNVLGYSSSGKLTGTLAFVGYSIEEGANDYTSYPLVTSAEGKKAEVDLTGKIAMLLRFEPMDEHGKSKWSDSRWSAAAGLDGKLKAAASRGASAIILVNPPGADDPRTGKLDDLSLSGRSPLKVPVVMISPEAADALTKAADPEGRSLMDLRRWADDNGGVLDLPRSPVTVDVSIAKIPLVTDNVGAVLEGVGELKDQYIVVGSHYDHVGYGYFGSRHPDPRGKLHPGADDNASGTTGNLIVSSRLRETWDSLGDTPRRSILFLAFSAEESGLIGSKFYTKHPIVPLEKHALMINMDMIGRLDPEKGLELGGVRTAVGLEDWLKPYIDQAGFSIAPKPSGLGPSDHASFASAHVPALFFFTGLHKQYHMPTDTPDLINVDGATQVADLAYRVALDAALRPEPFVFTTATGKDPSQQTEDDKKESDPNLGSVSGVGVRFGIAPGDYSGNDGVLIGEVFPELPAAKAGLKEGDRMIKWGDTQLTDVESWMPMLSKHKPGDKVTIVYIRKVDGADHEFSTEATLVARRSGQQ